MRLARTSPHLGVRPMLPSQEFALGRANAEVFEIDLGSPLPVDQVILAVELIYDSYCELHSTYLDSREVVCTDSRVRILMREDGDVAEGRRGVEALEEQFVVVLTTRARLAVKVTVVASHMVLDSFTASVLKSKLVALLAGRNPSDVLSPVSRAEYMSLYERQALSTASGCDLLATDSYVSALVLPSRPTNTVRPRQDLTTRRSTRLGDVLVQKSQRHRTIDSVVLLAAVCQAMSAVLGIDRLAPFVTFADRDGKLSRRLMANLANSRPGIVEVSEDRARTIASVGHAVRAASKMGTVSELAQQEFFGNARATTGAMMGELLNFNFGGHYSDPIDLSPDTENSVRMMIDPQPRVRVKVTASLQIGTTSSESAMGELALAIKSPRELLAQSDHDRLTHEIEVELDHI